MVGNSTDIINEAYSRVSEGSDDFAPAEIKRQFAALWSRTDRMDLRLELLSNNFSTVSASLLRIDERTANTAATLTRLVEGSLLLPKCATQANEMEHMGRSIKALEDAPSQCANCATTINMTNIEKSVNQISNLFKGAGYLTIGTVSVLFLTALWQMVVQ